MGLDERKVAKLNAAMKIIADAIARKNDELMMAIAGKDDGRHVDHWTYKDGTRALKAMDKTFNSEDAPHGTERFIIQLLSAAVREGRIDMTIWENDDCTDLTVVPDEEELPYTMENYRFSSSDSPRHLSVAIMRKSKYYDD